MVAAGVVVLLAGAGCEWDLPRGSESLLAGISAEPTPTEAAAWAIDKYDADKRFRGTLLLANASFGGEELYQQVYLDNIKDEDPGVRSAATRAIARHGSPDQAGLIIARLDDEDPLVRLEAARGLQRMHSPEAVEPLIRLISLDETGEVYAEDNEDIRAAAADALGQYAENRVVEALIAALADQSLAVNTRALGSLRTLTGQDYGYNRRLWLDWYQAAPAVFAARNQYTYPVFQRDKRWFEYLPLVPQPNNEPTSTPIGMPPVGQPPS